MTARTVDKSKGTSISIRRSLYEKVFSVVSEINFKCGMFLGRGIQKSDIFECLALRFTSRLMGLTELNLNHQLRDRSNPGVRKTTVYLNAKTSLALDNLVSAINGILNKKDVYVKKADILELLIIQCLDDVLSYFFSMANNSNKSSDNKNA